MYGRFEPLAIGEVALDVHGDDSADAAGWTAARQGVITLVIICLGEVSMSEAVKIRAIGNSLGVTLPREVLARHRMAEGDTLHIVDTADGFRLVRHDPEFARQMEVARGVMHRRREVLRELAK